MSNVKKKLILTLIILSPLIMIARDLAWGDVSGQTPHNAAPPIIVKDFFEILDCFFMYLAMPVFVFLSTKHKALWMRFGLSIIGGLCMMVWYLLVLIMYFF